MKYKKIFDIFVPLILIAGVILLVLMGDHFVGRVYSEKLLQKALDTEREYRIESPDFHHTLKPNFSSNTAIWGNKRYQINTNDLGFKDFTVRTVEKDISPKTRILIIGDSFTEGIGHPWEETFVGMFAGAHPELEVLNAGLSSYCPTLYFKKLSWLLSKGYKFDDVIVYIDISDIQDEGYSYTYDSEGNLTNEFRGCKWTRIGEYEAEIKSGTDTLEKSDHPLKLRSSRWVKKNLPLTWKAIANLTGTSDPDGPVPEPLGLIRGMWTFRSDLPCYGDAGVDSAIARARERMNQLATLLSSHGIRLSVAVYPWPDQIVSDQVESRQVTIWRDWCKERHCHKFINHFPDFFKRKTDNASYPRDLFLTGDAHYSVTGNRLIFERLNSTFFNTTDQ